MIDDVHRIDAYDRALRARIRPGDVVLDVGCGSGILSMLAVRCGAARVHAVESMPVARVAKRLIAENGMADRIIVHEADVAELAPVEPVDVVVSDFMGRFVADDAMLDAIAAAGAWLKPGGVFVPERTQLLIAPVGDFHMPAIDWIESTVLGIDLRPLRGEILNTSYGVDLQPHSLLAPAQEFADIVPPASPRFDRRLVFTVEKAGSLRGLAGWFDATFAPGVTLATGPGVETHWGQVLFPIAVMPVLPGDVISARVRLIEEEDWEVEWDLEVRRGDEVLARATHDTRARPGKRDGGRVAPLSAPPVDLNELGAAAYHGGRLAEAVARWEDATRVQPARDPEAPLLYENLGIAYLQSEMPWAAARAFLRALDGDPRTREQSLRFLVHALHVAGQHSDAQRMQDIYDATFTTPKPDET